MKVKKQLYIRELQLKVANERIKKLKQDLELKEKVNKVFTDVNADLSKSIDFKKILLDHFEQTIRECESACIDLQERLDKAEQVIGRMVVEQE
jgi:hypothetical protein